MIPAIFGCSGLALTDKERAFFQKVKPAGFILFARNIESRKQVSALTADLKKSVGRHKVPILIDQEGGRVQRMAMPEWRAYPPMTVFGDMAMKDPTLAASALRLNCRLIADDLRRVGITVNCLPLLDVRQKDADEIIGDRAFSDNPLLVAALGRIAVDALKEGGVQPVIKHIPGHGRAAVDSHLALPTVKTSLDVMDETDFMPFKAVKDAGFAMTAHIIYSAVDADNPATLSRLVISRIIRMRLGFRGFLMTDDLSMKALQGGLGELAEKSIAAGCDLALHCNGDMDEMRAIAAKLKPVDIGFEKRIATLIKEAENAPAADRGDLRTRYDSLMAKF